MLVLPALSFEKVWYFGNVLKVGSIIVEFGVVAGVATSRPVVVVNCVGVPEPLLELPTV